MKVASSEDNDKCQTTFKASYRPMVKSFAGEHNEAASEISEVYWSGGRPYLNVIIENRCHSFFRLWTYWTTLILDKINHFICTTPVEQMFTSM